MNQYYVGNSLINDSYLGTILINDLFNYVPTLITSGLRTNFDAAQSASAANWRTSTPSAVPLTASLTQTRYVTGSGFPFYQLTGSVASIDYAFNQNVIDVGWGDSVGASYARTIMIVFNPASSSNASTLVYGGRLYSATTGSVLEMQLVTGSNGNRYLGVYTQTSDGSSETSKSSSLAQNLGVVNNDTWYVATLTSDGTNTYNAFNLWLNYDKQSISGSQTWFVQAQTLSTYYGSGTFGALRNFPGKIAHTLYYDRKLSDAEIQQNYQYFASLYNLPSIPPTPPAPIVLSANYLIVGGGGGGGKGGRGGGGGAGGLVSGSLTPTIGVTYDITVGAGGSGSNDVSLKASNGVSSSFNAITASGGGGGGSRTNREGANGGSGGGGANGVSGAVGFGGTGSLSEGFNGGNGNGTANGFGAGGGGGASQIGQSANSTTRGGNGGSGSLWIDGNFYAGGGGGGCAGGTSSTLGGTGGPGGGGTGNSSNEIAPTSGTRNTGGGGGGDGQTIGTGSSTFRGGNGGDGVVIIATLDSFPVATTTGSPTVTTSGGYRYYKYTNAGSITFN